LTLSAALALALLFVLVTGLCPSLAPEVWRLPKYLEDLSRAQERARQLTADGAMIHRSVFGKVAIAKDVAAHRYGLLEAAARFRDLNRDLPQYCFGMFLAAFPAPTEEESYCRAVISYVKDYADDSADTAELIMHLEVELAWRLRAGPLKLRGLASVNAL
jgi:hypothetical protein